MDLSLSQSPYIQYQEPSLIQREGLTVLSVSMHQ